MVTTRIGEVLYRNPLGSPDDLAGWITEGQCATSFPRGALRLENALDAALGQKANFLLWCPEVFPADIRVTWKFQPLHEPGLAMLWFAAAGRGGRDLFDPALAPRDGNYRQYHSGDIDGYHLSYFRRKNPEDERSFHTCNLRKSHGFHLVAQGADPIPSVPDVRGAFEMEVRKCAGWIALAINGLPILSWRDDGSTGGPSLGVGRIGFRQMAPLIAEYRDLVVEALEPEA